MDEQGERSKLNFVLGVLAVSEVESGRKEEIERIRIKHVAEQETQRRDLREIFENEKFSIEGAWKS